MKIYLGMIFIPIVLFVIGNIIINKPVQAFN